MKRISVFLALILLLSLSVIGCERAPSAEKKPAAEGSIKEGQAGELPLVGISLYRDDDVYISMVREWLEKSFADKARLKIMSADNDQFKQDEQIDAFITEGASALVINLVDTQYASQVVDTVRRHNLPIIFFNREPDLASLGSYRDHICFIGTTAADAGRLQGDLIATLWNRHPEFDKNGDGKLQFIMFQGNPDNPEAVARTEFSVKQALENGVPLEQLGQTYMCAWDEDLAKNAMIRAIASYGENIELIIANNDSMALGAIAALAEIGYNTGDPDKFIPVVGVDATPAAVEAIQQGRMSATVLQDAEGMARAVADITLNAIQGKDFLADTDYTWDASGMAVRIPYTPFSIEE
jgi:methyl-galactoside transport system substrate-binding protein